MNVSFSVRLPVDTPSVPLVRGLLRQALEHIGVVESGIEEIVLALTEACADVVEHADEGEDYQVDVVIVDLVCRISVLDGGGDFDVSSAPAEPGATLDGDRSLILMRALVDRLAFRDTADGRHGVFLEKLLVTQPKLRLLT